ncbi:MAG: sigma-70 family RNA polymerase sigma factor [Bacteroidota bacterium]
MRVVQSSMTDQEVLDGIRKSNSRAVQYCYQEFLPRIQKFMASNNGTDQEAMDYFQEAMVVIYRKTQDAKFSLSSGLFTFLYAVVRNLWFKELAKRKRRGVKTELENVSIGTEAITDTIFEHDKFRLFQDKFQQLGEGCREILRLFFDGHSMKQISEKLQISEKYARKRKFNCKENLVKLIKADPVYIELSTHG